MDNAFKILKDMEEKVQINLDTTTYNTTIISFCKKRKLDEAFNLMNHMKSNWNSYNLVSYNIILSLLSKIGRIIRIVNYWNPLCQLTSL